jgi:hypothetical protein
VILRETNPSAYVRFVGACVQFHLLTPERASRKNPGEPLRMPRPLRMKSLLEAMDDGSIDVNNPKAAPNGGAAQSRRGWPLRN